MFDFSTSRSAQGRQLHGQACNLKNVLALLESGAVITWSIFSRITTKDIARPIGQDMGCLLWVQTYIHILSQSEQWCEQYRVISYHVITALDYIYIYIYIWNTSFVIIIMIICCCSAVSFHRLVITLTQIGLNTRVLWDKYFWIKQFMWFCNQAYTSG